MAKGALEKAMDFLSVRPLTEAELRTKLTSGDRYSSEEIDDALSQCHARGYLNDELLAADAVQFLNSGGRGRGIIRKKLRQRGVAEEILSQALEELAPEAEMEAACNAADGKLRLLTREKDARKKREKLFRFLISRGFSPDLTLKVVSEKLAKDSENDEEFPADEEV